jgi:hypothetical protein
MAEFCLVTKLSPAVYRSLTVEELKAFYEAAGKGIGQTPWQPI